MTSRAGWPLLMMAVIVLAGGPTRAEVLNPELPSRSLPSGEAKKEAAKAYEQAAEHYENDKIDAALTSAKLAYAMLPNASTAGLLCQMLLEKGDRRGAFEKCLVGLSLAPTPQEEGQLLQIMNELGRAVGMGWVDVKVLPETAAVKVGGVSFEGSRVIGLTPGQYTLNVTADGFVDGSESVSIAAGIPYKVKVQLAKKASALPPNGATAPPSKGGGGPSVTAIALLAAGGAVTLAGLGVQIAGVVKQSDANELADPTSSASQGKTDDERKVEIKDLESEADTLQKVAGPITMGLGGAVLVTGLVILLLEDDNGRAGEASASVRPVLLDGGGGLVLGGTF